MPVPPAAPPDPRLSGAASSGRERPAPGVRRLALRDPRRLRILQVTDLHFFQDRSRLGPAADTRTIADLQAYVERTDPDLVAMTGDLWHENEDHQGEERLRFAVTVLEGLGVPWLFTWGNHDLLDDPDLGHSVLAAARRSLYGGAQGGGNYTVEITGPRGESHWLLLCLNTGAAGAGEVPRAWLREQLRDGGGPGGPGVFCFLHIPLRQYSAPWRGGPVLGIEGEPVCFEEEDGSALPLLRALGVLACFCGHDHLNDFSVVAGGVELVYGRATGHAGYGGSGLGKGAKLITVNCDARRYVWETLLAGGGRWSPWGEGEAAASLDGPVSPAN